MSPLETTLIAQKVAGFCGAFDGAGGLLGLIHGGVDLADESIEHPPEVAVEKIASRRRRAEQLAEALCAPLGGVQKLTRTDPVDPRQIDHPADFGLPVEVMPEARSDRCEALSILLGSGAGERSFEGGRRPGFVDDSQTRREAQDESEVRDQTAADGVDRADPGRGDPVRIGRTAGVQKAAARTLVQLGGCLDREGGRQDTLGPCFFGDQRLLEHFGEPVGLAATGAGGDDLDAAQDSSMNAAPHRPERSQKRHGGLRLSLPSTSAS